jgi:hypothetical protein
VIMKMLLSRDYSKVAREREGFTFNALIQRNNSYVLDAGGPKMSAVETAWRLTGNECTPCTAPPSRGISLPGTGALAPDEREDELNHCSSPIRCPVGHEFLLIES